MHLQPPVLVSYTVAWALEPFLTRYLQKWDGVVVIIIMRRSLRCTSDASVERNQPGGTHAYCWAGPHDTVYYRASFLLSSTCDALSVATSDASMEHNQPGGMY